MASTTIRRLGSLSRALPSQTAAFANSNKPFLFLAAGTANGRKVSVLLEELKAAYGLDYECACNYFRDSAPHDHPSMILACRKSAFLRMCKRNHGISS